MNDVTVIRSRVLPGAEPAPQALPTGTRMEGFEIRGIIGTGGFGIVYAAWDVQLERQVALKEYFPATLAQRLPDGSVELRSESDRPTYEDGLRSFINEARLLALFDHPALVKVYRFWESAGTAFMVMPLYQGITLKQHVEQQQSPLEESRLLAWLNTLTGALEVMHSQQCYHRDISPENILIQNGSETPVLLDFGAARRAIGQAHQPFTVILKASYAPIEQYAELPSHTQGPWTDVYALAAVAHFLMTGSTPPSSVSRMVNDSYKPLVNQHNLPYRLQVRQAVDRALAVQHHERTQTMARFREDLLEPPANVLDLFEEAAPPPPPTPELPNTRQPIQKRPWLLSGLMGAAALCLLAIWLWAKPAPTKSQTTDNPTADNQLTDDQLTENHAIYNQPTDNQAAEEIKATPPGPEGMGLSPHVDAAFQAVLQLAHLPLAIETGQAALTIGQDLLQFQVQSPIAGHVAVYVRSSDNLLIQLLPNARVPSLTIEAGQKLTLPPASEPIQAAGPAGVNQFLVLVTERPRSYTHLQLQDHYGFGLVNLQAPANSDPRPWLEGLSECKPGICVDRLAAGWFVKEEVD